MHYYNKNQARERMNTFGAEGIDFLFVIDYSMQHCLVTKLSDINPQELLFSFPSCNNESGLSLPVLTKVVWKTFPESFQTYQKKFDRVQYHLRQGNSFLTNLTCKIPIQTNISLQDIYFHSKALYKLWIKDSFVCFSPEIFIRIINNSIHSYPMKGTISADTPQAEQILMENQKEAAEHATIVDLIRNDLSMISDHVRVNKYRYVDCLETNKGRILQTSSDICGDLCGNYLARIGEIIFTQLPAGSITGAPKKKTVEIISEVEDYQRSFYTGVMGVCKDGQVESAVMIRFVEQENNSLFFKAGGGITAQSNCEDEYQEVIQKAYVPIY